MWTTEYIQSMYLSIYLESWFALYIKSIRDWGIQPICWIWCIPKIDSIQYETITAFNAQFDTPNGHLREIFQWVFRCKHV